jgi:hypothetical protein
MVLRTTVEVESGRAVVRQVADPGDAAGGARLTAKGERLRAVSGAGVVEVVRLGAAPGGGTELVTRHAGLPIDGGRLAGAGAAREVVRQLALALAELHTRGVAHGAVVAEHVLVGPGSAVRLCGLEPDGGDVAQDLEQLGRLVERLAEALPPGHPDRDPLVALGGALADPQPSRRPSARRAAAALAELPRAGAAPGPARRRRSAGAAAVAAGAVALVVVAVVLGGAVVRRPSASAPARADRSDPTSRSTVGATTTTTLLPAPCVAAPAAPIAAAECGAAASVEGAVVTVDGHRAVVGRADDLVLVGDWGCEGPVRPALLRPATGEVLQFGAVDGDGAPEVVRAERVEGATALRAGLDRSGCAALFAVTEEGAIRLS